MKKILVILLFVISAMHIVLAQSPYWMRSAGGSAVDEGTGYYNCTWNSSGKGVGWWNITFYSGLANYNENYTRTSFYLSSAPVLGFASVVPPTGGWGVANYTYSVNVSGDADETINVNFYIKNETSYYIFKQQKTYLE